MIVMSTKLFSVTDVTSYAFWLLYSFLIGTGKWCAFECAFLFQYFRRGY